MMVHVLGVGADWWVRPGHADDHYRFTRRAAYFNTTGILQPHSTRVRRGWVIPGVVRFNGNSGMNPHRPELVIGSVYACTGIDKFGGWNRLLAIGRRDRADTVTHYLVAIDSLICGNIDFSAPWRNRGVRIIAASEYRGRQQSLLLLTPDGGFATSFGRWGINPACPMIELVDAIAMPENARIRKQENE
jgi:hypothetical protein